MIAETLQAQDAATRVEHFAPKNGCDSAQGISGPIRCAVIGSQPSSHHNWLRLSLNEFTNQGTYSPRSVTFSNEIEVELTQHPHIIWDFQECPYGVECLDEALAFTSGKLKTVAHMCQGNPYSFIEDSSPARGNVYYESVAPQLAKSRVDAIGVEKPNVPSLREFNLGLFGEKTIFLGLVDVADSFVEPPSQIADDIIMALKEVPAHQLVITPDCGIKHFPEQLALQKLQSMRQAVDAVNTEITKISLPQ